MTSIEKHQSPVHTGTGEGLPERFDDPGLPPHEPRRGDLDPAADKTSERIVLALFGLSTLGTIGFLVAYFALPTGQDAATIQLSNSALGLALACALLGIGTAAIHWAKSIMNNHERVEDRHSVASSPAVREAALANLAAGAQDSGISRRGLLKSALVGSLALFPLTIVVPLVGEVGENWDVASFKRTLWRKGLRLTTDPSRLSRGLAGTILRLTVAPQPISATAIRAALARGPAGRAEVVGLLPASVLAYIDRNQLYRSPPDAP